MGDEQVNNNRPLREYWQATMDGIGQAIVKPPIQADDFEINPELTMIILANRFGGDATDDPYEHVIDFVRICETFKCSGASDDAIKLRLFPLSLRDKAKHWLNFLPANTITTWSQLAEKFLRKYGILAIDGMGSAICKPTIQVDDFEINPELIQFIQDNQFGGDATDDPFEHVSYFLWICEGFKCSGLPDDTVKLMLFPFSLRDKAKRWLNFLPVNTITTWSQLEEKFLARFSSLARAVKLNNNTPSYMQYEDESLFETEEGFKNSLRICTHHGMPVRAAYEGSLMRMSPDDAYELIEGMATSSYNWQTERMTPRKVVGLHEEDVITQLIAQVEALTAQVEGLMSASQSNS